MSKGGRAGHGPAASLHLAAILASLPEADGEGNLSLFLSYLTKIQDRQRLDTFEQTMHNYGIDIGGQLMTAQLSSTDPKTVEKDIT